LRCEKSAVNVANCLDSIVPEKSLHFWFSHGNATNLKKKLFTPFLYFTLVTCPVEKCVVGYRIRRLFVSCYER
jgi:hypothetical protein